MPWFRSPSLPPSTYQWPAQQLPSLRIGRFPTIYRSNCVQVQGKAIKNEIQKLGLTRPIAKPMIHSIADELLLPLVKRVFDFLNTAPSGTDEAVLLNDLRKAYLNFIISLFNANLESILISERNISHLSTILQTILHFAKDNNDPAVQKLAFVVFMKMVTSWGASGSGDFTQFVYNELVPATFTVPTDASFNLADGQSLMVSLSIARSVDDVLLNRLLLGVWRN